MAEKWKVGDVVRLASGGPAMTVVGVAGDTVNIRWYGDDGTFKDATFYQATLIKATSDQKSEAAGNPS